MINTPNKNTLIPFYQLCPQYISFIHNHLLILLLSLLLRLCLLDDILQSRNMVLLIFYHFFCRLYCLNHPIFLQFRLPILLNHFMKIKILLEQLPILRLYLLLQLINLMSHPRVFLRQLRYLLLTL